MLALSVSLGGQRLDVLYLFDAVFQELFNEAHLQLKRRLPCVRLEHELQSLPVVVVKSLLESHPPIGDLILPLVRRENQIVS